MLYTYTGLSETRTEGKLRDYKVTTSEPWESILQEGRFDFFKIILTFFKIKIELRRNVNNKFVLIRVAFGIPSVARKFYNIWDFL